MAQGFEAVAIGAGGDDFGVVVFPGVQVVVVRVEAGFPQLAGLVGGEHAQRAADFHAGGSDRAHHVQHAVELRAVADLTPGRAHAEARTASGCGALGGCAHGL